MTAADFFFTDQSLSIVNCDEDGIIRQYEYDPQGPFLGPARVFLLLLTSSADPESKNGQALLCRSEFNAQMEYRSSATIARRAAKGADTSIPQAKLICGKPFLRSPG